ncbi:MAG TPA: MFS transporter [Candidatus Limnocylindrales bacterium]|nr:MFS transporter [Candidatus Limnocylindrales bacterium]
MDAGRSVRQLLALTAYWLGLQVLWGALTTIVLPVLVERAVGPAIQATALALVAGGQAVVAIAVQPVSGAWSDRVSTRFGRRRPWMVAGVAAQLLLLALVLPNATSLGAIAAAMLLIELASNTAQGPYQGLLPDLVPRGRRGLASGMLGAAQLGGQVIGVALAGLAVAAGRIDVAIGLGAAALAIGTATTALGTHEVVGLDVAGDDGRRLPVERGWRPWARQLREAGVAAWRPDVLGHRDYLWVLASRLAILMATGTLQPFVYYYLKDSLGLGDAAATAVAPIAALVAFVALAGAIPGGAMTARLGRVRTVALSAVLGAVGTAAFAVAPAFWVLFVVAVPFGLALGMFLAADWALMADLAPPGESGRYLGLSNTVTALAGLLAVILGGPIADLVNGLAPGVGFRAVFLLAAIEFLVGSWCVRHVHERAAGPLPELAVP